jgi:nucleoside-diphosphate-sugar epimerase
MAMDARIDAVTGAFGYTGGYIAARLLDEGRSVVTLTNRRPTGPLAGRIRTVPFDDGSPAARAASLEGVDILYNTRWLRFERGTGTFARAIERTRMLVEAARSARVRRFVHISVASADPASPIPYFAAKAEAERIVGGSGLSWAIVRPTLLFGPDDILINNLGWFLRRVPVFGLFGDGRYLVQPVHVEDVADLAVRLGLGSDEVVVDAAGPEILEFRQMIAAVRDAVGSHARLVPMPAELALAVSRLAGLVLRDVVLTRDEICALMGGLLMSHEPPTGTTAFSGWVAANGARIGRRYASELARNFRAHGLA